MNNKLEQRIPKGRNVLICGSQQFQDPAFVFMALETIYQKTGIRQIVTSKFSGACEFARMWAEQKNAQLGSNEQIRILDFAFDTSIGKKLSSFYETDIPRFALESSPFYQQGKESLIGSNVNLVVAFPNQEGVLGVATKHIVRFAELATIENLNCEVLLKAFNEFKAQKVNSNQSPKEEVAPAEPSLGFKNHHPGKKI